MGELSKAEIFLNEQLPPRLCAHLPAALKTAYASVEALIGEIPELAIPSAQPGHIRAWAAELAIKRLIDSGKLPFDYDWPKYRNDTGNWLRVRLPESILSVHQLVEPSKLPRKAEYRTNGYFNNQEVFDFAGFKEEKAAQSLPHLVLTHGHNELTFAHVGLPRLTGNGYFARTPNLLTMMYVVETEGARPEGAGVEPVVELRKSKEVAELKDDIVRLLKDGK